MTLENDVDEIMQSFSLPTVLVVSRQPGRAAIRRLRPDDALRRLSSDSLQTQPCWCFDTADSDLRAPVRLDACFHSWPSSGAIGRHPHRSISPNESKKTQTRRVDVGER